MKIFSEVLRVPEFERDMKRLLKRYKTLEDDLEIRIGNQLKLYHKLGREAGGTVPVFEAGKTAEVYKTES